MAGLLLCGETTLKTTWWVLAVVVVGALMGCGSGLPDISLVEAVELGNVEAVERHMEAGTDPNESFVPPGEEGAGASALHLAVLTDNREVVTLLLENGADIDIAARDEFHGSPLEWAVFFGLKGMAIFLVERGADLNATNAIGGTPLDAANSPNPFIPVGKLEAFTGSRAFLRGYLVEKGAESGFPEAALLEAIDLKDVPTVRALLESGANPEEAFVPPGIPAAGASALHLAVLKEYQDIVRLLLDSGADIDVPARDAFQGTPLEWAAFFGLQEMVELLVEAGADVNSKNAVGDTPLDATSSENPFIPPEQIEEFERRRGLIREYLLGKEAVPGR